MQNNGNQFKHTGSWLHLGSLCCFGFWIAPLITWRCWQDTTVRESIHRLGLSRRPSESRRVVHLAGREIEHLFFMEREWARVKWDRRVCRHSRAVAPRLSVRGNDRQQIREAAARWLTPALSDWQRKTHRRFSSLVINSVCLVSEVEATPGAQSRGCLLKSILNKGVF